MQDQKKPPRRKPAPSSPWCDSSVDVDSLTADQRLAHELVVRRRDLTPSVARIMDASMTPTARSRALAAFSTAVDTPGDPNRDPRVAIAFASAETT